MSDKPPETPDPIVAAAFAALTEDERTEACFALARWITRGGLVAALQARQEAEEESAA